MKIGSSPTPGKPRPSPRPPGPRTPARPGATDAPAAEESWRPFWLYLTIGGIVLFLAAIELPYDPVVIPQPLLVSLGLLSLIVVVFLAFENFFLVQLILVCYLPFSALLPGDFGGFLKAFNLTNILTVVIVVGWLARGGFRGERIYRPTRADALLAVFCALASVSLVRGLVEAQMSAHVLDTLKRYLTPFFYFYVFANNVRTRREIQYIYAATAFICVVAAGMALKESYLDIGYFSRLDAMRVRGITMQPNDTAAFFTYYTPFVVVPFLHRPRRALTWMLPVATFACFWAMTRTFSRGGIIAFAVTLLATIALRRWRAAVAIALLLAVLLFAFPQTLPESVVGRFQGLIRSAPRGADLLDPRRLEPSAARRIRIWKRALPHMARNPLLGIGYGHFGHTMRGDAHNGFILIAAEMGFPALFIYLGVLVLLARAAWRLRARAARPILRWLGHAYLAAVVGVVVANQFGSRLNSQELSSLFWILGGLTMMADREMRRGNPEFSARGESSAPEPAPT